MLKLSSLRENYWIDVGPGVRLKVRPCTSVVFYQARAFMTQKLREIKTNDELVEAQDSKKSQLLELNSRSNQEALSEHYMTLGLARAGVIDWEGIVDSNTSEPVKISIEKINQLFENHWMIAESFRQQYMSVLFDETEKKS